MTTIGTPEHVLLKKGGALFRHPKDVALVADTIGARIRNGAPIRGVVVSALYGATDDLYTVAADPTSRAGQEAFERIVVRYTEAAGHCAGCLKYDRVYFADALSTACATRKSAPVVALGEQWAARLFGTHLDNTLGGCRVTLLDPCDIISVEADGYASASDRVSLSAMRTLMSSLRGVVLVMPGFHGRAAEGTGPALMYRDGSDVSVGLLAQVLNRRVFYLRNERVTRIEKVTATPGILSTDPVFGIPGRAVPYLTHTEALEGAQRAEFVHELLLDIARTEGFDVYVTDRSGEGTLILPHDTAPEGVERGPVALITGVPEVDTLIVSVPGSFRTLGMIATLYDVLDKRRVNIYGGIPGTNSYTVITLPSANLRAILADDARRGNLFDELRGRIDTRMRTEGLRTKSSVTCTIGKYSSVTVVGSMAGLVGLTARKGLAYTGAGININAWYQTFGEANITSYPLKSEFASIGEALHEEFFAQ